MKGNSGSHQPDGGKKKKENYIEGETETHMLWKMCQLRQ